jgi:hypothetical protein
MRFPHCHKQIDDKRTIPQNSAYYLWLTQIEAHCWERGLTLSDLYKEPAEIPITKEYLRAFFKRTANLMYGVDSTTQLKKKQMSKVVDACQRIWAERLDYSDPFPSMESMENEDLTELKK